MRDDTLNHAHGAANTWGAIPVIDDGAVVDRWKPVGRY